MKNKIDIQDVIQKFWIDCLEKGLIIDSPGNVNTTGKITRCKVINDKAGAKSGAYWLRLEFPYNGFIQNWKLPDDNNKWIYYNKSTYKGDFVKSNKYPNNLSEELKDGYLKTAWVAYKIYKDGQKYSTGYNYLIKKHVKPYGIVFGKFLEEDNVVIVPGRDISGKIWTLQFISSSGQKRFLKNSKKSGMFHKIGFSYLPDDYCDIIFVSEGYATGASIHMATNKPTICTFDAGNMLNVSEAIRLHWPKANIILCADLDYAGIKMAEKASSAVNGKVVFPDLKTCQKNLYTDFNDLHYLTDLDTVKNQINTQLEVKINFIELSRNLIEKHIDDLYTDVKFSNIIENILLRYSVVEKARDIYLKKIEDQDMLISQLNPKYREIVIDKFLLMKAERISLLPLETLREQEVLKTNINYQEKLRIKIEQVLQQINANGGVNSEI